MAKIPRNVAEVEGELASVSSQDKTEFELLETERLLRKLQRREYGQRISLRWIAVATGLIVIVCMGLGLAHVMHSIGLYSYRPINASLYVALVVAPILSITSITVALFIGAFRRFEDRDLDTATDGAASAFKFFGQN